VRPTQGWPRWCGCTGSTVDDFPGPARHFADSNDEPVFVLLVRGLGKKDAVVSGADNEAMDGKTWTLAEGLITSRNSHP